MDDQLGKGCIVCDTKGLICDHDDPCCRVCQEAGLTDVCSYDWSITNRRVLDIFHPQPDWEDRLEPFSEIPNTPRATRTCGSTYRASVKDGGGAVAVKVLFHHLTIPSPALKLCIKQAWRWKELNHTNVLPLLGVANFNKVAFGCPAPREVCFISPWMEEGNILQYLDRHPESNKLILLADVIEGLSYLHEQEPPVIHGGLRAGNFLIQMARGSPKAVLTDFGNSQTIQYYCETYDPDASYTPTFGNPRWLAFERLRPWDYSVGNQVVLPTTASDVFELLRAFLEIFTRNWPFFYIPDGAVISVSKLVTFEWKIPDRPSEACPEFDDDWWLLMQRTWDRRTEERPTLLEIHTFLNDKLLRVAQKRKGLSTSDECSVLEMEEGGA